MVQYLNNNFKRFIKSKILQSFTLADRVIVKRFAKNTLLSIVGSFFGTLAAVFRMALLTKFLYMADYGKILIIQNFTFLSSSLLNVSLNTVINRFYPQLQAEGKSVALRGLLVICFSLTFIIGFILCLFAVIFAPWVSCHLYDDMTLVPLFRANAVMMILSAFNQVTGSILRLSDAFRTLVVNQIFGQFIMLSCIFIIVVILKSYNLTLIVLTFVLGILAQTIFPFIRMVRLVSLHLKVNKPILRSNRLNYKALRHTLLHANLSAVLRLTFSPGDLFFLGIFGTQQQVALYGLAKNLIQPFLILQNNVQLAITPEVMNLWAKKRYGQLKELIKKYIYIASLVSGAATVALIALAKTAILLVSKPEYLNALPVMYLLTCFVLISTIFLVFYPIGIVTDNLSWFNVFNLVNITGFGIYLMVYGSLNAMTMACIVLLAAVNRRIIGHLWVGYLSFKRVSSKISNE